MPRNGVSKNSIGCKDNEKKFNQRNLLKQNFSKEEVTSRFLYEFF